MEGRDVAPVAYCCSGHGHERVVKLASSQVLDHQKASTGCEQGLNELKTVERSEITNAFSGSNKANR